MMASVKFIKGSEEWLLFTEYWDLCQELWNTDQTDEYWEYAIHKANAFYKRHNTQFARSLANALMDELERRSKENK